MRPFPHDRYTLIRNALRPFGGAVRVLDGDGRLVLLSESGVVRSRGRIRLYGDEERSVELLTIHTRQAVDFAVSYDVDDPQTGEHVGALRRQGFKSMVRDRWALLDSQDREFGTLREESLGRAVVRRLAMHWFPQTFHATIDGRRVASFRQRFHPLMQRLEADFGDDEQRRLDRRLGLAAAVLLHAIEVRQR